MFSAKPHLISTVSSISTFNDVDHQKTKSFCLINHLTLQYEKAQLVYGQLGTQGKILHVKMVLYNCNEWHLIFIVILPKPKFIVCCLLHLCNRYSIMNMFKLHYINGASSLTEGQNKNNLTHFLKTKHTECKFSSTFGHINLIQYQRHLCYCRSIFNLTWLLFATCYIWYKSIHKYPSDIM